MVKVSPDGCSPRRKTTKERLCLFVVARTPARRAAIMQGGNELLNAAEPILLLVRPRRAPAPRAAPPRCACVGAVLARPATAVCALFRPALPTTSRARPARTPRSPRTQARCISSCPSSTGKTDCKQLLNLQPADRSHTFARRHSRSSPRRRSRCSGRGGPCRRSTCAKLYRLAR